MLHFERLSSNFRAGDFIAFLRFSVFCSYIFFTIFFLMPGVCFAFDLSQGFADIVEPLIPAVVNISTYQRSAVSSQQLGGDNLSAFRHFGPISGFEAVSLFDEFKDFFDKMEPFVGRGHEPPREIISLGSGFIIDRSGVVVTNYHVIANASEINVIMSDNKQFRARVLGSDPETDLAVLKVDPKHKLPYVSFSDADDSRVGDWVIAVGNPFGLGGSVSVGIVSAISRDLNVGTFAEFIQTDAAINKGNSGGPLFDVHGRVVGINTAIFSPSGGNVGIGFAIPAKDARDIVERLSKGQRISHGWLGVKVQVVNSDLAESLNLEDVHGALVAEVTPNGPADQAGLMVGDIIVRFDGVKIKKMAQLPNLVGRRAVGKVVPIEVYRKGKVVELSVKVGDLRDSGYYDRFGYDGFGYDFSSYAVNELGIVVSELRDDKGGTGSHGKKAFRRHKGGGDNSSSPVPTEGVVIVKVDQNSDAAAKGLRAGDFILGVNQDLVKDLKEFKSSIESVLHHKPRREFVSLLVSRDGKNMFISLRLK